MNREELLKYITIRKDNNSSFIKKSGVLHIHQTLYHIYKYLKLQDDEYESNCVKPYEVHKTMVEHFSSIFRLCEVIQNFLNREGLVEGKDGNGCGW